MRLKDTANGESEWLPPDLLFSPFIRGCRAELFVLCDARYCYI